MASAPGNLIRGTSATVRFASVVDGDTVKIYVPGSDKPESVRILSLDTEESYGLGSKPVTPWGKEAKTFAKEFFQDATEVTIEFPGNDEPDVAFQRYRGNFGRLLVYVYHNGVDFQEVMIRKGYSPYYTKYGNAEFSSHHLRYQRAERDAQVAGIGVWDQVSVNGTIINNYAALQTWWHLRARIIDEYRELKATDATVYNSRKDYTELLELAKQGKSATVFTEVRSVRRAGGSLGLISIGSQDRPFTLKIPDLDSEAGQRLLALLRTRYMTMSLAYPRRGYCYTTGPLELYRGAPQLVLSGPDAVTDSLEMRAELVERPTIFEAENGGDEEMTPLPDEEAGEPKAAVVVSKTADVIIAAALPNPEGADRGNETVTLRNRGGEEASLDGWLLRDRAGRREALSGSIASGSELVVKLSGHGVILTNTGSDILLLDEKGAVVNRVTYSAADVSSGQPVTFL